MPHFDPRNRDMNQKISLKYLWLRDAIQKIRLMISEEEFSNQQLKDYLMKKWEEATPPVGRFVSNITYSNTQMTLEQFINKFINSTDILSGYCTLFKDHTNVNIGTSAIKYLLDSRKKYKKKMTEYEKGSDEYTYYKVLQQTFKILANSYYGILGLQVSPFFNPFIQNSTTLGGQDLISTCISSIEQFFANNCPFNKLDDIVEFILNVKSDKVDASILEFAEPISAETLFEDLVNRCRDEELDEDELRKIISKLSSEDITRIYYKNRPLQFVSNSKFLPILKTTLTEDYSVNEEFRKLICDYTFYDHILHDRFKRAAYESKRAVIVTDTDSIFIHMNDSVLGLIKALGDENVSQQHLNLIIDLSTEALARILWTMTTNVGIEDEFKPVLNMKNESTWSAPLRGDTYRITPLTSGNENNPKRRPTKRWRRSTTIEKIIKMKNLNEELSRVELKV